MQLKVKNTDSWDLYFNNCSIFKVGDSNLEIIVYPY